VRKLGWRLKQFALLIDVNPFVTGCGNRGGKSKAGTNKGNRLTICCPFCYEAW
jgi:hypothetical protein